MKKKVILVIVIVFLLACCFITGKELIGVKPFKYLSRNDISAVTVKLVPPNITSAVNNDEVNELVEILNRVVTYRKDNSFTKYSGQMVAFTIIKTDGSQLTVNAYYPFIIINGTGYKTKYEPCEQLNRFANNLESNK